MTPNSLAPWRDASLILLALEAFILGLLPLAILYLANRGMRWLLRRARPVFAVVRGKADTVEQFVALAMNRAAAPFVTWHSSCAGVRGGLRRLWLGRKPVSGRTQGSPLLNRKSEE